MEGYVQWSGEVSMTVSDAAAIWSAYQEDPEALFEVLEESIANSIEGVSSDHVHVYSLQQQRRRLKLASEVRRLQASSGSLTVLYAIIMLAQDALDLGVDATHIVNSTNQGFASSLTQSLAVNADRLGLDGSVTISGVLAVTPTEITGDAAADPPTTTATTTSKTATSTTVSSTTTSSTTTSTTTVTQAPLEEAGPVFYAMVGGGAALAFCFMCCAFFCWRNCRRPDKGSISLSFMGRRTVARFNVTEDAQADENGKIHVVWDVDMAQVESYFNKNRETPEGAAAEEDGTRSGSTKEETDSSNDPVPVESRGEVAGVQTVPASLGIEGRSKSSWSLERDQQLELGFVDDLMQAVGDAVQRVPLVLPNASKVEYFSTTHKRWLPAELRVKIRGTEPVEVIYDVVIKSGPGSQLRNDVQPLSFRAPLEEGEKVDVYAGDSGGWVSGVVARSQRALLHGYGVTLCKPAVGSGAASSSDLSPSSEMVKFIPAARVRRRFEPGDQVLVYKGPAFGWDHCVVDDETAPDDQQISPTSFEFGALSAVLQPSPSNLSAAPPGSEYAGSPRAEQEDIQLWSMVSVHDVAGESSSRLVPSYLMCRATNQVANWTFTPPSVTPPSVTPASPSEESPIDIEVEV